MKIKNQYVKNISVIFSYIFKIFLVILIIISISRQEFVHVFASCFALILSLIPAMLKRNYQITLPLTLDLLITLSLFFHFAGEILSGYSKIPHYDTFTHFISGLTVAFLAFIIIYILHVYWDGLIMDKYAMAFLVIFCTIAMGVVWEFIEWISDLLFSTSVQWGYDDTIKDLAMDTIAGVIVALTGVNMIKKGSFQEMTDDLGKQIDKNIIKKMEKKFENNLGEKQNGSSKKR